MTEAIGNWEKSIFLDVLPELRLAFTSLTRRDTHKFVVAIQKLMGDTQSMTEDDIEWSKEDLQIHGYSQKTC